MYFSRYSETDIRASHCFQCAVQSSLESNAGICDLDTELETFIERQGKSVVPIDGDGHCMVRAWYTGLFLAGCDSWTFEELINDAVSELLRYPNLYKLSGSYGEELKNILKCKNYMSDAVDAVP